MLCKLFLNWGKGVKEYYYEKEKMSHVEFPHAPVEISPV
jgi:hypothetical protein